MRHITNPYLPKARIIAMQLLIREQLPPQIVAAFTKALSGAGSANDKHLT